MLHKLRSAFVLALATFLSAQTTLAADDTTVPDNLEGPRTTFARLSSGIGSLDRAFRIALGDLITNIVPFKAGLLEDERHVILAGLEYGRPWTRDAAINTWNGGGLLFPTVTRDTLLSVLERRDGKVYIGGQYWDCIVWAVGAWSQYLYTGDKAFLSQAFDAVSNTLEHLEATEFDAELGLFRGAASSSDGVAGYPVVYAEPGGFSGISEWPRLNPERRHPAGFGVPMHALSTNCLYYRAYTLLPEMAAQLERPVDPHWAKQAATLKKSLNDRFWREQAGQYRYTVDPLGDCDHAECLGQAYAVLFGVADDVQVQRILAGQHIAPAGIPVLWPTFDRYRIPNFQDSAESGFGRHSGCIWPPFEAIWATTARHAGRADLFLSVLEKTAEYACRDNQFVEMYHPLSGLPYGGLQEGRGNPRTKQGYDVAPGTYLIGRWRPRMRQTWSATGYIRQVLLGVLGMDFSTDGVTFEPVLPSDSTELRLTHLPYRRMTLHILVTGPGTRVAEFTINGQASPDPFLAADGVGDTHISMTLAE